jgi:hypothetical protein
MPVCPKENRPCPFRPAWGRVRRPGGHPGGFAQLSRAVAHSGSPATGTFEAPLSRPRRSAATTEAARSLAVLVALVLMCTFGLAPGQQHVALGIEIFVLGVVLFAGVMITTLRTMSGEEPDQDGGLFWALAEIVCGLVASVTYAWVLRVEILR